jgi:uncharacterized protein YegL
VSDFEEAFSGGSIMSSSLQELSRSEPRSIRVASDAPWPPDRDARSERARQEFIANPELRVPCLMYLDVSGSMEGQPLEELETGLRVYVETLAENGLSAKRAETAIITFGGYIRLAQEFATLDHLNLPPLRADGDTPLCSAVLRGLELLAERKRHYQENAIPHHRPFVFLLTDGVPTDTALWDQTVRAVRDGEKMREFEFFSIGVGEHAELDQLGQLSRRKPQKLRGYDFASLFRWIGVSMRQVSCSQPGETIRLNDPTWTQINL